MILNMFLMLDSSGCRPHRIDINLFLQVFILQDTPLFQLVQKNAASL